MKKLNISLIAVCGILFILSIAGRPLQKPDPPQPEQEQTDDSENQEEIMFLPGENPAFNGQKIIIEIEYAYIIEKPVQISDDKYASGKKCIRIREGAGKPPAVKGKAVCNFSVNSKGSYRLWGRRWWRDACGNSLSLSIKGESPVKRVFGKKRKRGNAFSKHTFGEDSSYNLNALPWTWTKGDIYLLDAGEYTLSIFNREDGIKLDQVLLVEILEDGKAEYIPSEIEKPLE